MSANAATPVSMAAMPARRSCLMPNSGTRSLTPAGGGRQFAGQPHGALDEHPLHRRRLVDPGHPALRDLRDLATAAREQPVECIDGRGHEIVFAATPALIAAQDAFGARI